MRNALNGAARIGLNRRDVRPTHHHDLVVADEFGLGRERRASRGHTVCIESCAAQPFVGWRYGVDGGLVMTPYEHWDVAAGGVGGRGAGLLTGAVELSRGLGRRRSRSAPARNLGAELCTPRTTRHRGLPLGREHTAAGSPGTPIPSCGSGQPARSPYLIFYAGAVIASTIRVDELAQPHRARASIQFVLVSIAPSALRRGFAPHATDRYNGAQGSQIRRTDVSDRQESDEESTRRNTVREPPLTPNRPRTQAPGGDPTAWPRIDSRTSADRPRRRRHTPWGNAGRPPRL